MPQVVNALEPLFLPVIQAVVFLSVWIVVRVLCRMLGRVLRGINAIPLIGGLNRILGFAFGFGQRFAKLLDLVHSAVGGGKPDRRQAGIFDHSHPEQKRDLWTFGKPEPVFDPLLINNI